MASPLVDSSEVEVLAPATPPLLTPAVCRGLLKILREEQQRHAMPHTDGPIREAEALAS